MLCVNEHAIHPNNILYNERELLRVLKESSKD